MNSDIQYQNLPYHSVEIEHKYGPRVHILANPVMQSVLARIGRPETVQPQVNHLMERLYEFLILEACNALLPREHVQWDTRMIDFTEAGRFDGEIIRPTTKAVIVDLARAGTFPSHISYHRLHDILEAEGLRQDHFYLNRKVNEKNEVIGVDVSGSKIGGGQQDAYVFFPDPMGATGGSLSHCVSHYKNEVEGKACKYIALHIIVTPEYIKRMQKDHPDVEIFALRLDRGLSPQDILTTIPGTDIEREVGLTSTQYIVPGAGGVGEVLNNSFV
jgi:uracil phosphoribosyltransferase